MLFHLCQLSALTSASLDCFSSTEWRLVAEAEPKLCVHTGTFAVHSVHLYTHTNEEICGLLEIFWCNKYQEKAYCEKSLFWFFLLNIFSLCFINHLLIFKYILPDSSYLTILPQKSIFTKQPGTFVVTDRYLLRICFKICLYK